MYFEIGKYLSEKVKSEDWGSKAIDKISFNYKIAISIFKRVQ